MGAKAMKQAGAHVAAGTMVISDAGRRDNPGHRSAKALVFAGISQHLVFLRLAAP